MQVRHLADELTQPVPGGLLADALSRRYREEERVIPACARNNSCHMHRRASSAAGHPCVCGEQVVVERITWLALGSSLRVRGTGYVARPQVVVDRVIPACAGNSIERQLEPWSATGHPCVCGEQVVLGYCQAHGYGSSLRVRGTGFATWGVTEFSPCIQAL